MLAPNKIYTSYMPILCLIAVFFTPIKLSVTYICLAICILSSLYYNREIFNIKKFYIVRPYYLFLALFFISSLFGINVKNSVLSLLSLLFFSLSIPVYIYSINSIGAKKHLKFLFYGTMYACTYRLLDGLFPEKLPDFSIGLVTQSGQLSFIIPLLFVYYLNYTKKRSETVGKIYILLFLISLGLLFNKIYLEKTYLIELIIFIVMLASYAVFAIKNKLSLFYLYAPIIITAFIINLKRGPWMGVTVSLLVMSYLFYRKLFIPLILLVLFIVLTFDPVQSRLLDSFDHFFISGGRSELWNIGIDLIYQYPFGVGFDNSRILQLFSLSIPDIHNHFHNNFINIWSEGGILTFISFIYFLYIMFSYSFKRSNNLILIGSASAILAWQIAGLVEYNFGDSEVLVLFFFTLALLEATLLNFKKNRSPRKSSS